MTQNAPTPRLYLLVPWELPHEQQLNEVDQTKLRKALNQLLQALKQTSPQKALTIVNQELATIEIAEDFLTAEIYSTETPLKVWEVEDFDNYFGVTHIKTQQPAICLVGSILFAYKTFLEISIHSSQLDPIQVDLQKRGFETYAHLLARVFNSCLEET